jgi:hypothetical protein
MAAINIRVKGSWHAGFFWLSFQHYYYRRETTSWFCFFLSNESTQWRGIKSRGIFRVILKELRKIPRPESCWLVMDQLILHDPQHCLKSNSIKGIKKQVKGFFFSASEQTKESFHNCTSSNWKGRNRGSVNSIELANDFR